VAYESLKNLIIGKLNHGEELDGPAVSDGVRSRKLSNVGQSLDQKFFILSSSVLQMAR
jgi:hypothetical protein